MSQQGIDESAVLEALKEIQDPDLHRDIVSLGFVKQVSIDGEMVSVVIELTTPACPVKDQMRDQAETLLRQLPGVEKVHVEMTANVRSASSPDEGRAAIPGVRNIIAVGAGKGGVGKTTVSVNLACALARHGSRVGLLDGDVYGPNVPIMLGAKTQLETDGEKIVPAECHGIRTVSIGFLTQDESPVIWRGPMLHGVIQQFFREVNWGELDYLVIDMPPGTGDVALSLSQTVPVSGAVAVTTPQTVSLADTRRAIRMYQKLNIPVLGLLENMSHFVCPSCSHESDIFGKGGGESLAEQIKIPFLGQIPLYEPIRVGGDQGTPIVVAEPECPAAQSLIDAAARLAAQVSIASYETSVDAPVAG
ncbi:MAG: Mrp/NBP35 family ATP-binding protein [Acidobacteriota bacterium]|nr:Mrp/NBP35 family ATP-binding protein [Acidobacteriota bacterium]MED5376613.1 Mrp/NBP35 family ATP-binding protein [Acidobacteriota bacterium]